jgi:hypothetical protein
MKAMLIFAISGPWMAFMVVTTHVPPGSSMRRGVAWVSATLRVMRIRVADMTTPRLVRAAHQNATSAAAEPWLATPLGLRRSGCRRERQAA